MFSSLDPGTRTSALHFVRTHTDMIRYIIRYISPESIHYGWINFWNGKEGSCSDKQIMFISVRKAGYCTVDSPKSSWWNLEVSSHMDPHAHQLNTGSFSFSTIQVMHACCMLHILVKVTSWCGHGSRKRSTLAHALRFRWRNFLLPWATELRTNKRGWGRAGGCKGPLLIWF